MAVTQNTYTGNGSTVLFSFTFPYLETTDIKVSVNGTVTTAYTLANATTIQFNTAPANGAAIRIYRQTDDAALAATFYPGSAIRSQDLNENFTQNLYVTQESTNNAATATTTANTALTNSTTAIGTANTALSTANTASSNASAAVATANTASSNASAAVSTANTASSNATTAVNTANAATATANSAASDAATALSTANAATSTANAASAAATNAVNTANAASSAASSAVSTANTASTNASYAVTTANTASSNATTAVNTANSAVATANSAAAAVANAVIYTIVANVAAIPASPSNNTAIEVANSTGIESFTPLAGKPGGFVGNSGLSVRILYSTAGSTWNWVQYFPNDPEARYLKLAGGTLTGALLADDSTSVASPVIAFDGDANTGIAHTGADELALVTGGTARVTVDPSGAVAVTNSLSVGGQAAVVTNDARLSDTRTPTDNTVSTAKIVDGAVTSAKIADGTIVNADVSASAAIAGTKISPDFGSQTITTTGVVSAAAGSAGTPGIAFTGDLNTGLYSPGSDQVAIATGGTGRLFVNSDGTVSVGNALTPTGITSLGLRVSTNTGVGNVLVLSKSSDGTNPPNLTFCKSRGTAASPTAVTVNDVAGSVFGTAYDGSTHQTVAGLQYVVESLAGSNDISGNIQFQTRSSGVGAFTQERLRITSAGLVGIGTSSPWSLSTVRSLGTTGDVTSARQVSIGDSSTYNVSLGYYQTGGGAPFAGVIQALDNNSGTRLLLNPSGGNVGIGTTSPQAVLHVERDQAAESGIFINNPNAGGYVAVRFGNSDRGTNGDHLVYGGTVLGLRSKTGTGIIFEPAGTERARIDSSGRLLVGTSSALTNYQWFGTTYIAPSLQIANEGVAQASLGLFCNNAVDTNASQLMLAKAASGTAGLVNSGETLGIIAFNGGDGTNLIRAAEIMSAVDGTPGANDMPGRLVFSTTADGASSPTERMRITQAGYTKITSDATFVSGAGNYHEIRQHTTDATLIVASKNASYATEAVVINIHRAANSAYHFLSCKSGDYADNEFMLRGDGQAYADGSWNGGGADYAEFFEWADSNPDAEDRRGISVVLDGDKIRETQAGEDPIGVISGNPSVVGDAAWNKWSGKYLRDEFGTYIQEDYEVTDDDGNTVTQQRRKLNPAYDPDVEYISREQRPEWDCVGLMGKLRIRKGQVTGSRWIKMRDISDSVEEWLVR